jgi:hypothetical protein
MEDKFAATGCGVDIFGETLKADVACVKLGEPFNKVFEGTAEPVKPPDHKDIALPNIACRWREIKYQ